ncbi:right-handed parallel beta-helix repeat-containing protein [Cellulomonas sp. URHB0016]
MAGRRFVVVTLLLLASTLTGTGASGLAAAPQAGPEHQVNDPGDADSGHACTPQAAICTLRAAIELANKAPDRDVITFRTPMTIRPTSVLPVVVHPIVIDGLDAPGSLSPRVEITGSLLPRGQAGSAGLVIAGGDSVVRGLVVNDFPGSGIVLRGPQGLNAVESCYIGTDLTGEAMRPNGTRSTVADENLASGISIEGSPGNTVGGTRPAARNVISGNVGFGVGVLGWNAVDNVIKGNVIGTSASGVRALPNEVGVALTTPYLDTRRELAASRTTVGGLTAAEQNVISGNLGFGVMVRDGVDNQLLGNLVGVGRDGTTSVPNGGGVLVTAGALRTIVGDSRIGAGNVVSANLGSGIRILGGASETSVVGNRVGLDAADAPRGNAQSGIDVEQASLTTIRDNVIASNGLAGVLVAGSDDPVLAPRNTVLETNVIGTDRTGLRDLGNAGPGVWLQGAVDTRIGAAAAGLGNRISGNDQQGVRVAGASRNTVIAGNEIGSGRRTGPAGPRNEYAGVAISEGSTDTTVGAPKDVKPPPGCSVACNLIVGNGTSGVVVADATTARATVRANVIAGNAALGIDLRSPDATAAQVTPNDPRDADSGPNGLLNFPVAVLAYRNPDSFEYGQQFGVRGAVEVTGVLTTGPIGTPRVDVYGLPADQVVRDDTSPARVMGTSYGQGPEYLGEALVLSDGTFRLWVTSAQAAAFVTYSATVTDGDGNTSEFSAVCTPLKGSRPDRDRDALCDEWETQPLDIDGDASPDLDLRKLGASAVRPNVFLEVDAVLPAWMPGRGPLLDVQAAFRAAPRQGIDLCFVGGCGAVGGASGLTDELTSVRPGSPGDITVSTGLLTGAGYADLRDGLPEDPADPETFCDGNFGTAADRAHPPGDIHACWARLLAKRVTFRYALFADEQADQRFRGSGGVGEFGGHDLAVTLGPFKALPSAGAPGQLTIHDVAGVPPCAHQACFERLQADTLMHELGHTLGLLHGGDDSRAFKPNYLSVMNYLFEHQLYLPGRPLDYSRRRLTTLDEGALNEPDGVLGPTLAAHDPAVGRWPGTVSTVRISNPLRTDFDQCLWQHQPLKPVDWNQDGSNTQTGIGWGINDPDLLPDPVGPELCENPVREVIDSYDDWRNLDFNHRVIDRRESGQQNTLAAVLRGSAPSLEVPISLAEQRRLTAEIDTDGDLVPNSRDNCVTVADADQLDSDDDGIGDACVSLVRDRDLSLAMAADPETVTAGGDVTVTLRLRNDAPLEATDVVVRTRLSPNLKVLSAAASLGTVRTTGRIRWVVPAIAGQTTATLTIRARAVGAESTSTAEIISAGQPDPDSKPGNGSPVEDDLATIRLTDTLPPSDLYLTSTLEPSTVILREPSTATLLLVNMSSVPVRDVRIRLSHPATVTLAALSTSAGSYDATTREWTVPVIAGQDSATLRLDTSAATVGEFPLSAEVVAADRPDVDSTPGNSDPGEDDSTVTTLTVRAGPDGAGSADEAFGDGGFVRLPSPTSIAFDATQAPDGTVIAVGRSQAISGRHKMWVAKLAPDGRLDTTFDGDGIRTYDFTGVIGRTVEYPDSTAFDVDVQPDGRILISGQAFEKGSPLPVGVLMRLHPDGTPDASLTTKGPQFHAGSPGVVLSDWIGRISRVDVQADGRLVLLGDAGDGHAMLVARLEPDGAVDRSFGAGGLTTLPYVVNGRPETFDGGPDLDALPDGGFVALRTGHLLARLDRNGNVLWRADLGGSRIESAVTDVPPPPCPTPPCPGPWLAVAGGTVDQNAEGLLFRQLRYGLDGAFIGPSSSPFSTRRGQVGNDMTVAPDGSVIVVGHVSAVEHPEGGLRYPVSPAIARFVGPDVAGTGFGASIAGFDGNLRSVMIDAQGRALVAGDWEKGALVGRYLLDGSS